MSRSARSSCRKDSVIFVFEVCIKAAAGTLLSVKGRLTWGRGCALPWGMAILLRQQLLVVMIELQVVLLWGHCLLIRLPLGTL